MAFIIPVLGKDPQLGNNCFMRPMLQLWAM